MSRALMVFLLPLALACDAPKAAPSSTPAPAAPMETESSLWLRVDPAQAELAPGAAQAFRPSLNYPKGMNYLRPPVKWSVQEGEAGGSVDAMGHYTAPSAPGTYHVAVERTDAPGVRAVATVTVR